MSDLNNLVINKKGKVVFNNGIRLLNGYGAMSNNIANNDNDETKSGIGTPQQVFIDMVASAEEIGIDVEAAFGGDNKTKVIFALEGLAALCGDYPILDKKNATFAIPKSMQKSPYSEHIKAKYTQYANFVGDVCVERLICDYNGVAFDDSEYNFENKKPKKGKKGVDDMNNFVVGMPETKPSSVFNNCIGNPPFGDDKNKYWAKCALKELKNLPNGGVLFLIIPQSFIYHNFGSSIYLDLKNEVMNYNHVIDLDMKKYFTGIGSSFCALILERKDVTNNTTKKVLNIKGEMAGCVNKIMLAPTYGNCNSYRDVDNDTHFKKSFHSDIETPSCKYKILTGVKYLWSSIEPQYYSKKRVVGNRRGTFAVAENLGTDADYFGYIREGFEDELYQAYTSKLIKDFLVYCRVGTAIPHPVMRQLPDFSNDALLAIRKVLSNSGNDLTDAEKANINDIVKSDLGITSEDESALAEMLNKKVKK